MNGDQQLLDEQKQVKDFVNEAGERLVLRSTLLTQNLAVVGKWPDETFFAKKDSTLKKNTAFVKKVRNFLDSQKEVLLAEFEALNLSKYVEEVSTAIVEAKIKTTDIPFILKLCSAMHQRYSDFGSLFLDAWKKVFASYKDVKHANLSKLRVDLALFADLNTLTALTNGDLENFANIGIICSFCRHCSDDWIGLIPRRIRVLGEKHGIDIPRSNFMLAERQAKCRSLFQDYLSGARRRLAAMTKEARRLASANRDQLESRGEVSEERQERASQLVASCRKFHESVTTLADLLDSDPPPDLSSMIKEDPSTSEASANEPEQADSTASSQLFEDEDTRLFYESLPDIKAMVPGILYKDSEQAKSSAAREKSEELDAAATEDIDLETVESELAKEEEMYKATADSANASSSELVQNDKEKPPAALSLDEGEEDPSSSGKVLMETFLTQLPNCVNRDLIDRAAIDFCLNLNKRSNRRRLARTLLAVPRTRYDLLPFYARLVAALAPVMPDLVQDVNTMLTGEFRWRASKRDQLNLESKLKIVRFIGELVKFRIFPAHQALGCLKQLLPQFVHHNIEMACALLDTCGRFLYRLPSSHQRTKVYLEVMLRKKTALHMDQRYTIMIENTYYYCNPPPVIRQLVEAIELTPAMQFLRHSLWHDLDRTTVNSILRLIRKMDWDDPELVQYAETLFTRAWELRFTNVNCLASILSGLAAYHRNFAAAVVDNVIEDIRVGMELNLPQFCQRRICMVKYLGLLYNYCLVDSPVVFKTLYSLLTFGVSLDNNFISLLDPPDSLFRITLICTLLETSGGFFDRGKKRRKLNIFLVYFQRYFWFKRSQPIWIQPETKTPKKTALQNRKDAPVGGKASDEKGEQADQDQCSSVPESDPAASENTQAVSDTGDSNSVAQSANDGSSESQNQLTFTPVPFPAEVEQHYTETLSQLRLNVSRAQSLTQAQRLVSRLEARYLPRFTRLKATYGLINDESSHSELVEVNGQDDGDNSAGSQGSRPPGPGHMDPIAEEVEPGEDIPLDEEEYAIDDDDEDEDEEDDDVVSDGADDENHGRRRAHASSREPDGNRHRGQVEGDFEQAEESRTGQEQLGSKPSGSDDDHADSTESEEERAIRMGLKPRFVDCPEDAEFREALDRMTAEALLSAGPTGGPPSSSTGTVASPADSSSGQIRPSGPLLPAPDILQLAASRARPTTHTPSNSVVNSGKQGLSGSSHTATMLSIFQGNADEDNSHCGDGQSFEQDNTENDHTVVFNLVTRRGNRPHLVPLAVPDSVQFAARYMQAEAAEREEKARMKQLVLEMHEAQKEEEMEWGHFSSQDAVLAHQYPVNVNRDRWVRYNHPKGAPDADAVFGTSSQRR
ncbi:unnamed protein product [Calicophoron daubneyi]|uniref:MIF4G domain-containing protein n=1 Tax=Calicophoron daubneyi TaxID=300641 RepID=A0AAV2TFR6_CALDB